MTKKPRRGPAVQKSASHQIIGPPRPITSSSGSSSRVAEGLVAELHPGADRGEQLLGNHHCRRVLGARGRQAGHAHQSTRPVPVPARRSGIDRKCRRNDRSRLGSPVVSPSTPSRTSCCRTGFEPPAAAHAVLREGSVVGEAGRYAWAAVSQRGERRHTPYADRAPPRGDEPVLLVPGFLAGDGTLALMRRALRGKGFRTYRSHIRANVGCTLNVAAQLEMRLESIAQRRGTKVRIVGHSLGGMLARGVAVTASRPGVGHRDDGQPDARAGRAPRGLTASVAMLVRLSRAGVPGADVGGLRGRRVCARRASTSAARRWPTPSTSPRSTPGATASSTGGRASTRWRRRWRCAPRTSGWRSTRG